MHHVACLWVPKSSERKDGDLKSLLFGLGVRVYHAIGAHRRHRLLQLGGELQEQLDGGCDDDGEPSVT